MTTDETPMQMADTFLSGRFDTRSVGTAAGEK
jgi:hypothetical protein